MVKIPFAYLMSITPFAPPLALSELEEHGRSVFMAIMEIAVRCFPLKAPDRFRVASRARVASVQTLAPSSEINLHNLH
jgi:hypothetical protein